MKLRPTTLPRRDLATAADPRKRATRPQADRHGGWQRRCASRPTERATGRAAAATQSRRSQKRRRSFGPPRRVDRPRRVSARGAPAERSTRRPSQYRRSRSLAPRTRMASTHETSNSDQGESTLKDASKPGREFLCFARNGRRRHESPQSPKLHARQYSAKKE